MEYKPRGKRLFVEVVEVDGLSDHGFILPDTVSEWIPPTQGRVVAVGMEVERVGVGETVLYGLGCGEEYNGVLILHENDIICMVD